MSGIETLRRGIHTHHISDLLPIKALTEENRGKYDEYALSSLTYKSIINKYPFLNNEPLYATKGLISNYCYYYDKESLFPIPLIPSFANDGDRLEPVLFFYEDNVETQYKNFVNHNKKLFKDGTGILFVDCDTMAFEFLRNYIDTLDKEKIFDIATELYINSDYGFGVLDKDLFDKIIKSRTDSHLNDLKSMLKDLPEEVTIYRGEGDFSTPNGYSYSLDKNIAVFFASKSLSSKKSRIIEGKIKKEDILWYSDDRNEKEVLIYPENVYNVKEIDMYSAYDEDLLFCTYEVLDVYQNLRSILKSFPYRHKGKDHSKLHMLRVLFFWSFVI